MLCAYLDETGNTGANITDPIQRYHSVGAVVVPEQSLEKLRSDLLDIATDALGKRKATAADFEFHGNQLFSGNSPWAAIPDRDERLKVYAECLDLLKKHKIRIAYGRCDKKKMQRYSSPMHPHEVSFWLALERIGSLFQRSDSLGFIVADECAKSTKQIARKGLDDYRKSGPPFGNGVDISRIIDTVHFMNSRESPHLQMCDLCLWIMQRFKSLDADAIIAMERDGGVPTLRDLYRTFQARVADSMTFPYN
jgi:Protein of unknown function (DUF3800)